jgi:exodeoxyribonuclease VII small subunit
MNEKSRPAGPEGEDSPPGFDARLARLERIVQEMEQGGLGLEEAIGAFQEGVGLLKGCREVLAGYRKQVEELTRDAESALRPYAADPDVEPE